MGWLSGWTYRKSITLSRASGAVSNYQMQLLVGESSGATGEDVDCGGNCLSTFNDLRFTTSDGETLLDYWIESISGTTVKGLMPEYGYYDDNTLVGMAKYGYDYLVTDSLTDRSVPKIVFRNEKPILVFTKTARDDYQILHELGLKEKEHQIYTYEEDINRLLFEGGLYVLKLHTEYQLQPQNVDVLNDIIKYAKDNNLWLASVDDILNWWKRRGNIEVRYEWRSKRRISVEVTNPSETLVEEFVAEVNINKPVKNVKVSSEIINTQIPEYEFDPETNSLYMYVKNLESNETRIFLIDFENVNP